MINLGECASPLSVPKIGVHRYIFDCEDLKDAMSSRLIATTWFTSLRAVDLAGTWIAEETFFRGATIFSGPYDD